jgi:hypothetical protein
MKERELTGNKMFKMVEVECERSLGNSNNNRKEKQKRLLFSRKINGKWGWFVKKNKKDYSRWYGEIENGLPNGKGTETLKDGSKYVGEFKDGAEWNGTYYDKDGTIRYKRVNGKLTKQ